MACRAGDSPELTKHARLRGRSVWVAISMALLAGCGSARGSTQALVTRRPTRGICVKMWNRASQGDGRLMAAADAAYGRRVLLFAFSDSVCGVAFPSAVAGSSAAPAVYVSGLRGDYPLANNPLSGPPTRLHLLGSWSPWPTGIPMRASRFPAGR